MAASSRQFMKEEAPTAGTRVLVASKFDLIINTTDAELPWDSYVATLAPKGKLHTVPFGSETPRASKL